MGDPHFSDVEISDPRFERDGLRFITVRSPALRGHRADICCWAPPLEPGNEKLPLAVLLHGAAGSAWSWPLRGGAHLTTARLIETGEIGPLALAMPSDGLWGGGSGYVPHPEADYERWIVDEVAAAAALADDRIDPLAPMFIAGLSMGGFGALRLGAKYPTDSAPSRRTRRSRRWRGSHSPPAIAWTTSPASDSRTAPRCIGWT